MVIDITLRQQGGLPMRFVKQVNEFDKASVYLDLQGLQIPNVNTEDIDPLCHFRIDTYMVLKSGASDFSWNAVFGPVHSFLDTLSKSEQADYASMIIGMHYRIIEVLGHQQQIEGVALTNLEAELSMMLAGFDQKIHLFDKLLDFTETHIPIQSFAGVGERAQDSVEMTFYRDDVVKLTAVVVLCKMMTVIFGIFIESCKKRMDNLYKELHCSAILKNILENNCRALVEKLLYFISRISKPMLNRVNLTHLYNGFTFNMIIQHIYAFLLTRRSVAVDLFKPDSNLMKYCTSCIRASATTQFSSNGFKMAVSELETPDSKEHSSEDDGNISTLETESRSSAKTADYQVLVKSAVVQLINNYPAEYELDPEIIKKAQDFYEFNHVQLTPANSYLMCTLFGDYLGGAHSIEMLDAVSVNKLVPVLQAYLFSHGYPDLVHLVSAVPTDQLKGFLTGSDTQLKATWNSSFEYKNCEEIFPFFVNELKWDTGLKLIMEEYTTKQYLYNTAPCLWEKLGDTVHNNEIFQTPETICRSICSLINHTVAVPA